jgi:hypothetical protein
MMRLRDAARYLAETSTMLVSYETTSPEQQWPTRTELPVLTQRQHDDRVKTASNTARQLFESFLTPKQKADIRTKNCFYFDSNLHKRWAIQTTNVVGNCFSLDDRIGYCAQLQRLRTQVPYFVWRPETRTTYQPFAFYPYWDHFLAQMLAIQTDENAFCAVAHPWAYGTLRMPVEW